MKPVAVRVDERLRLAGCLLAAGDWPEREQTLKPYRPHRLAESARRALGPQQAHPAVQAVRELEPAQLFRHALAGDWPAAAASAIADFAVNADVELFCAESQAEWQASRADLESVLARCDLAGFLHSLWGEIDGALMVHPNVLYPGRQPLVLSVAGQIVLSQPPPAAWGASPPWRYSERPDEVLGSVAEGLARALLEQAQVPEASALALAAAVLFLRQAEGAAAADQFMLMEKRLRKLPDLPDWVAALEKRQVSSRALRPGRDKDAEARV